ncbi:DNA-deoxyinosine glycosylase [Denitratisoma sp. agr-D3]
MARLSCLAPIVDERAQVLILGSFPSAASLAAQRYYAHKQNQFWSILAALLAKPLPDLDYADRQTALKAAGIAVWDVFSACERQGSLDSAIRRGEANDFASLLARAPLIRRACFNGRAAGKFAPILAGFGLETVVLPSTSPANAGQSFDAKLAQWRQALGPLLRPVS